MAPPTRIVWEEPIQVSFTCGDDSMELTLDEVADVFCRGVSYTASFTHPYVFGTYRGLRILKDAPRRSGDERKIEFIIVGMSPDEACDAIRELKPGRFFACPIDPPGSDYGATKEAYKQQDLRCLGSEPIFVRTTSQLLSLSTEITMRRVTDPETADRIKVAAGRRQILAKDVHGGDADLRLYAAFDGENPIAWVKSIRTGSETAWVSNLFVQSDYRRRGIGKSIVALMLADDARYGVKWSVLAASSVGSVLYESMAYQQVGLLQMFAPKKELWGIAPYR